MYKYLNCSEIVPQCLIPQVEGFELFWGYGANSLGIRGQKGPKTSIFVVSGQ